MQNLHYFYAIVEEALLRSHVNPVKARKDKVGKWTMQRGSATVWLDIWHDESDSKAYFQAMSPVLSIPENRKEALFLELLQHNNDMLGTFFCLYEGQVWVKINRECSGMDANEAYQIIQTTGKFADHYDDILQENYAN